MPGNSFQHPLSFLFRWKGLSQKTLKCEKVHHGTDHNAFLIPFDDHTVVRP